MSELETALGSLSRVRRVAHETLDRSKTRLMRAASIHDTMFVLVKRNKWLFTATETKLVRIAAQKERFWSVPRVRIKV